MFEHLADPTPPLPGDAERAIVSQRASALRRSRQRWLAIGGAGLVVVVLASAIALSRDTSTQHVATNSNTNPSPSSDLSPGDAFGLCFAPRVGGSGQQPARTIAQWPSGLAPLLAVDGESRLWVVRDGTVEEWTSGHEGPAAEGVSWARWAPDGSIYVSRLVDGPIEIDRFTGPGQATKAFELPFTVSQSAPPGICPIDGDMDTFTLGTAGFVFPHHVPGPIPISCPSGVADCSLPEATTFERRDLQGLLIGSLDETTGGGVRLISESTDGSWIAKEQSDSHSVLTEQVGANPTCCSYPAIGQAFALAPDGARLAAVDGAVVSITLTRSPGPPEAPRLLRIDPNSNASAMAWTSGWIVVGGSSGLTLVADDTGTTIVLDGFSVGTIICLDFASPS